MSELEDDKIAISICASSILAFEEYDAMTEGGYWLGSTPEYWYTTNIAQSLNQTMKNRFVVLENSVTEIHEYAQRGKARLATSELRAAGRADISLWTKNWKPRAIIEVKKGWHWDETRFAPDIQRLLESLRDLGRKSGVGTLNHAYFVLLTDTSKKTKKLGFSHFENLEQTIATRIKEKATKFKGEYLVHSHRQYGRFIWNGKKRKKGSCFAAIVYRLTIKV